MQSFKTIMKVQSLSRTNFKGYSNVISLINAPIDDKSISYIAMKLDNNGEKDLDKYIEIQKMQNQYKGSADDILSFAYSYNKRTGLDMFYFQGKPMFFGSELLYLEENFVPRAISKKDYKNIETIHMKIYTMLASITKRMRFDKFNNEDKNFKIVIQKLFDTLVNITRSERDAFYLLRAGCMKVNKFQNVAGGFNKAIVQTMGHFFL